MAETYRNRKESSRLTELSRILITSSSLKAYIDLLGRNHRQSIASWLYGNTSQILSSLFHYPNGNIYCSDLENTVTNSVRSGIGQSKFFSKYWKSSLKKIFFRKN